LATATGRLPQCTSSGLGHKDAKGVPFYLKLPKREYHTHCESIIAAGGHDSTFGRLLTMNLFIEKNSYTLDNNHIGKV
jgi:hypothetical protein